MTRAIGGVVGYFWRSCHSSCQAIWMASSLLSLDFMRIAGEPRQFRDPFVHVGKADGQGSTSGNLSVKPMAMSSIVPIKCRRHVLLPIVKALAQKAAPNISA